MAKRLVLVTLGLWVALYASQWLVRVFFNTARLSIVENPWGLWVPMVVLSLVAAWVVAVSRGATGGRAAIAALVSCVGAYALWLATGAAIVALPWIGVIARFSEAATIVFSLIVAAEVVAVSWFVAGVASGWGARGVQAAD